jgi:hypothetical protein
VKKWIRWEGILAFIAVVGLVFFFWAVLLDGFVRRGIERTVAFMVGAEVNVDKVDLVLSPLGFVVTRIQVTNPENPATNAVEVGRAAFTLDTAHLFMRKTIIDEMGLEGVALGTPRQRPGRVYREREEEVSGEGRRRLLWFTIPDISREDIRRVIESANLETLKSIQALHQEVDEKNSFWTRSGSPSTGTASRRSGKPGSEVFPVFSRKARRSVSCIPISTRTSSCSRTATRGSRRTMGLSAHSWAGWRSCRRRTRRGSRRGSARAPRTSARPAQSCSASRSGPGLSNR